MIIRGTYYGDKADIWSCGCILLELTMGHEKFCDEWMTAYDYEVLQDKADFAKEIRLTIERLVDALSFSNELNELVCKFLRLRSSLRPGIREVCADAWFGGIISLGPSASVQSPSPQMSPSVTNRHSVYGIEDAEGGTEVDPELLQKSFQSMSERERQMYEKHNEHIVGDDRHHLLHLPPIEPQTPNMQAARKILKKGADLVSHVSASGAGKRQPLSPDANAAGKGFSSSGLDSPDLSSSPLSPSDRLNLQREWSSSAKMGSPSRTGSASQLPGLSEAAQEKDEDDEGLTGAGAASASSRQKTRKKSTDNAAAAAATAAAAMAAQAERDASSPPFIRSPRPGPDARWS
jgi:serine/threonine protein kinase